MKTYMATFLTCNYIEFGRLQFGAEKKLTEEPKNSANLTANGRRCIIKAATRESESHLLKQWVGDPTWTNC